MSRTILAGAVLLTVALSGGAGAQESEPDAVRPGGATVRGEGAGEPDREKVPPLATSGDFEIESLEIRRERTADAPADRDRSYLEVDIWLAVRGAEYRYDVLETVDLVALAPVEDDTGRLLTPPDRLLRIRKTQQEQEGGMWPSKFARGKGGRTFQFRLDVPAREATSLKVLKGTAVVSHGKPALLTFPKVGSLPDAPLEDARLGDLKIIPKVVVENGETRVSLSLPKSYPTLGNFWLDGAEIRSFRTVTDGDRVTAEQTYAGDASGRKLVLSVDDPKQSKTLTFEFRDVPLP